MAAGSSRKILLRPSLQLVLCISLALSSSPVSGGWVVSFGLCAVTGLDDECVQSPNWPNAYPNSDLCSISWNESVTGYISVVDFSIHASDYFSVDGMRNGSLYGTIYYTGGWGLDGSVCYGDLFWYTDSSDNDTGWKICLTGYDGAPNSSSTSNSSNETTSPSSDWHWEISGDGCTVDPEDPACLTSSNYSDVFEGFHYCDAVMSDRTKIAGYGRYLEVTDFYVGERGWVSIGDRVRAEVDDGAVLQGTKLGLERLFFVGVETEVGWRICARDELGAWSENAVPSRRRRVRVAPKLDESGDLSEWLCFMVPVPFLFIAAVTALQARKNRCRNLSVSSKAWPSPDLLEPGDDADTVSRISNEPS